MTAELSRPKERRRRPANEKLVDKYLNCLFPLCLEFEKSMLMFYVYVYVFEKHRGTDARGRQELMSQILT